MKELIANFQETIRILRSDKLLLLLASVPIVIGIILYAWIGQWIFVDLFNYLQGFLSAKVESSSWLKVFSALFVILLSAGFYVLVSWTFLVVVGLFASPFNDLMARRVEKLYLKEPLPALGESLGTLRSVIWFTLMNESKKILFIVSISILSVIIGFFLPPVALFISISLIAFSLVDYTWAVHDLSLAKCLADYRKNFFFYTVSGGFFFLWISIPVLNLLVLPFGVTYFTIGFLKKHSAMIERGE